MNKIKLLIAVLAIVPCALFAQQTRDARYYEMLTANLSQHVRNVQDQNAQLELQVSELQKKLQDVSAKNEELSEEMQKMKRQFAAESEAREAQMKRISEQLLKLATMPPPPPVVVMQKSEPPPPPSPKAMEYEEYTVAQGATLLAIAGAYNVTVQDIKKANNLKSDFLSIGQKLKIPIKK